MPDAPFDLQQAHRYFAIECNNAAWELLESVDRSPDETDRMLHLAHAALEHWSHAGAAINRLRALTLLTFVHVVAGSADLAMRFAAESVALAHSDLADVTAFDRAAAHVGLSLATRASGHSDQTAENIHLARQCAVNLAADEREAFERLLTLSAN